MTALKGNKKDKGLLKRLVARYEAYSMDESTKDMFEEFFTPERWSNWGTEMDFLRAKIQNRMVERE